MPINPYQPPQEVPRPRRKPRVATPVAAAVSWAILCAALVVSFRPPPQPRYNGSWDPFTVLVVAMVCYGPLGLLVCPVLAIISMNLACLTRGKFTELLILLNVITWIAAYSTVPLWNQFFRMPE